MFINNNDLKYNLYPEIIQNIARNDNAAVDNAILTAMSIMEAHLCNKYDTSILFAQTGIDRNAMLVDIASNIALYILANVLDNMPVGILDGYERGIKELEKLNKGKTTIPGAPIPTDSDGAPDTFIKYGSIDRKF